MVLTMIAPITLKAEDIVELVPVTVQEKNSSANKEEECLRREQAVKDYIDAKNYCEKNEDCAAVSQRCPFGCLNYVHKDFAADVEQMITAYINDNSAECGVCIYECIGQSEGICENNKCVDKQRAAIPEAKPLPEGMTPELMELIRSQQKQTDEIINTRIPEVKNKEPLTVDDIEWSEEELKAIEEIYSDSDEEGDE